MDIEELAAVFEKYTYGDKSFDTTDNIRADLGAFLLLDKLVPGTTNIVAGAEYDELFLDTDVQKLAQVATEEDIRQLVHYGVRYSRKFDCLCMFV